VELLRPLHEGTQVTMRREFTALRRRDGRSGPMLMFTVRREYVDGGGELLVRMHETFIAR
jgi:hypothetical protein